MGSKADWYQLPEEQCERLTRQEFGAVLRLYTLLSDAVHFENDMGRRLECVPNGKKRMRLLLGQIRSIVNDITGTIPVAQCRRIMSTMNDYESRLVPKFTPSKTNVLLDKEQARTLVDFARVECRECVRDSEECRSCKLYELLVAVVPCDNYGNTFLCPYNHSEWGD